MSAQQQEKLPESPSSVPALPSTESKRTESLPVSHLAVLVARLGSVADPKAERS